MKGFLCHRFLRIVLTKVTKTIKVIILFSVSILIIIIVVFGPDSRGQHSLLRLASDKVIDVIVSDLH